MSNIDTKEVLAAINKIRHDELGAGPVDELPKGWMGSPFKCPVACALQCNGFLISVAVGSDGDEAYLRYRHDDDYVNVYVDLPEVIVAFVRGFDNGDYPELIER